MKMPADASRIVDLVNAFSGDGSESELRLLLQEQGVKKLRTACTRLQIRPQAKAAADRNNKRGYVAMLCELWQARKDANTLKEEGRAMPTTVHRSPYATKDCPFRLVNVLFSELFAGRLGEIHACVTRHELDTNAVNKFWQDVEAAFASGNPDYNGLNHVSVNYEGIDPRRAPPLTAPRLRKMWSETTSRYMTAVATCNNRVSGTTSSEFLEFCDGRLDTLYLHDWLEVRKDLFSHMERLIPKRARWDTLAGSDCKSADSESEGGQENNQHSRAKKKARVLDRLESLLEREEQREQQEESVCAARKIREWVKTLGHCVALAWTVKVFIASKLPSRRLFVQQQQK